MAIRCLNEKDQPHPFATDFEGRTPEEPLFMRIAERSIRMAQVLATGKSVQRRGLDWAGNWFTLLRRVPVRRRSDLWLAHPPKICGYGLGRLRTVHLESRQPSADRLRLGTAYHRVHA
jgi:hypothetical protein